MKKFFTLILALMMMFTLGACSGQGSESTDAADVLEAELEDLKDSANQLGALYNELLPVAQSNGWLEDELFTQEANASAAMVQLASDIIGDPSILEGESAQDIIDGIDDMTIEWDTNMRAKLSKPYVAQ